MRRDSRNEDSPEEIDVLQDNDILPEESMVQIVHRNGLGSTPGSNVSSRIESGRSAEEAARSSVGLDRDAEGGGKSIDVI